MSMLTGGFWAFSVAGAALTSGAASAGADMFLPDLAEGVFGAAAGFAEEFFTPDGF